MNQRRESRHHGFADTARLMWSGGDAAASILNVSECGLMMQATTTAGIGETVHVCFEGCAPIPASVIWRKDDQIGVDLGQPVVDLVPRS